MKYLLVLALTFASFTASAHNFRITDLNDACVAYATGLRLSLEGSYSEAKEFIPGVWVAYTTSIKENSSKAEQIRMAAVSTGYDNGLGVRSEMPDVIISESDKTLYFNAARSQCENGGVPIQQKINNHTRELEQIVGISH